MSDQRGRTLIFDDLNTRLMARALYCENFSYEDILKDINQIEKDNAYNSSHLLLALTIMRKKGIAMMKHS